MKTLFGPENLITAFKGMIGMSATTTGVYVSILPQVEAWLRVISLLVGIAVGLATFISIVRGWKRKQTETKTKSVKTQ